MSNENESEVVLRLRVVQNAVEAAREVDKYRESVGDGDRELRKFGNTLNKAVDQLNDVSSAAKGAGASLENAAGRSSSKQWIELTERVSEAAAAHRLFRQEVATGNYADMGIDDWLSRYNQTAANPVNRTDIQAFRDGSSGSLLGDEAAETREAARAKDDLEEAERRLAAAQRDRAQSEAAESNRQMEIRAGIAARTRAENELTEALRNQAAMQANAASAARYAQPRSGSFMAGGGESGLRASDTSWVADEADRMQRARFHLAEYDRQLNSTQATYRASTSALGQMLIAERATEAARQEQINSLPRLRYALYDVSTSLLLTGGAMATLGIATAAVGISMQRDFADVVRTSGAYLDPTGRSVARLRGEFEQLFATLPASWADLTDIGTLAGQLDVPMESIDEFTRLVAMFTATTDVSVEASATAFGRLAQLLGLTADQYEKMGSSILAVGVSSVATESQIIAISKEIASVAVSAGFSADQVFGLSSALASLGTAPELSRGVVTRLFANIGRSINESSESLEVFGDVAGMSGDEFAKAWGEDASGALLKLMEGLGQVENSKAIAVLSNLGVEASRDVPTILRLAQNSEVLAKSLDIAGTGYENGTELAQQYSVISSTVAEKLQVLVNNFQLLVGGLGEAAGGAGFLIDALIGVTQGLTAIVNNPVAGTIAGIVVAVGTLGGIFLLLLSFVTRGVASMYAMRTAMNEMGISADVSAFSVARLNTALLGTSAAAGRAAVAGRVASVALRALTVAGLATLAVPLVEWFNDWTKAARDGKVDVEALTGALAGTTDASSSLREIDEQIGAIARAMDTWGTNIIAPQGPAAIGSMIAADLTSAEATLSTGLLRLGQKTTNFFATPGNFGLGVLGGESGLAPWASMIDPAIAEIEGFSDAFAAAWSEATTAIDQQAILDKYESIKEGARTLALDSGQSASDFEANWNFNFASFIAASEGGVDALELVGEQAEETADLISGTISSFLDVQNAILGTENALYSLGDSLGQNGAAWDQYSEAGRSNMSALMDVINAVAAETPGNASAIAANLQALFESIVRGGYASAEQLTMLGNIINGLSGGKQVTASSKSFVSMFSGIETGMATVQKASEKAAKSVAKVRVEVRTLSDYANDLGGVFSRAFEIRWSGSQGLDTITSGWAKLREAAEAARKAAADYQLELRELTDDRSVQEYWLGIAEMYGDEMRAAELRTDIAKTNSDIAKTQAELAKSQDKASMSLSGNSDAALENRGALLGLVGNYQSYIQALAASGMSQAELQAKSAQLKQEFIAQATQMGFSRAEVDLYAHSFDDMTVAISRVPRNITVTANANPALQALAEFEARARAAAANAQTALSGVKFPNIADSKGARQAALTATLLARVAHAEQLRRDGNISGAVNAMDSADRIREQLRTGNYWTGGYVGDGGKYEPKGVVHGGEFVFSKEATSFFGTPLLSRMHAAGKSGQGFAPSGGGGGMPGMVELGPATIHAIVQGVRSDVFLDGRPLAASVSQQFASSSSLGGN